MKRDTSEDIMSSTRSQRDASPKRTSQPPTETSDVPSSPPVREEYPGPQETSTGERIDPGNTEARPDSPEERRGRRRGAS
jgi:hypothetical protein